MPLIAPQPKQQREQVNVRLDVDALAVLKRYAEFIASSVDYVVSQAVVMTFGKDQDFRQWLRDEQPQDAERLQKRLSRQARPEPVARTPRRVADTTPAKATTPSRRR
jgi:uncharacterized protein YhjY with autotransporter beta-barrel domain